MNNIYLAIDIEKSGPYLSDKIVSIGLCLGDDNSNIIEKKRFNIKVNWPDLNQNNLYKDFDKKCWNEFWCKLPKETIDACKLDAMDEDTAFDLFNKYCNNLEEIYPKNLYNIILLSDNLSFDISSLDYVLNNKFNRYPLSYSSDGSDYRTISSVDDMFEMLPKKTQNIFKSEIKNIIEHNHNPQDDAQYIYMKYMFAKKYKNN